VTNHLGKELPDSRRRPWKIRYTDAEWAIIVARARASGHPPARYVRETSLGTVPRARRGARNADIIHELGRIGTTLAQLAATGPGAAPDGAAEFELVLADLLAVVRRLDPVRRERPG
jgi:hypothetical protein